MNVTRPAMDLDKDTRSIHQEKPGVGHCSSGLSLLDARPRQTQGDGPGTPA